MNIGTITLHEREFDAIRRFIHAQAGISLAPEKRTLVSTRLEKRLRALGLDSYAKYVGMLNAGDGGDERRTAVDLLTTNETYFFREPRHFQFLSEWLRQRDRPGRHWRVWCAAASTGEEPYSIAMTLADALGPSRWSVTASDISTRVLETARRGVYPMTRLDALPVDSLKRHCLRGTGPETGNLAVDPRLRAQVQFMQINLNADLPDIGPFDVVFLRNVLIYFDAETKRRVVARVADRLVAEGCLLVSLSENLHGVAPQLAQIGPSIYCKRA
jgi:chemotaxis protein methyltransferase CheR